MSVVQSVWGEHRTPPGAAVAAAAKEKQAGPCPQCGYKYTGPKGKAASVDESEDVETASAGLLTKIAGLFKERA